MDNIQSSCMSSTWEDGREMKRNTAIEFISASASINSYAFSYSPNFPVLNNSIKHAMHIKKNYFILIIYNFIKLHFFFVLIKLEFLLTQ